MALELINPDDLPSPPTYTQVVVAAGNRLVFVAGQEPEDVHGNLVGSNDLAAQARQVFTNLGRALAAGGARPDQVVKITIYLVQYRSDYCRSWRLLVSSFSAITSLPTRSSASRHSRSLST